MSAWRRWTAAALSALGLALLPLQARAGMAPTGSASLSMTVGFRGVMMITDLRASSGPAGGQITLTWTAPDHNQGVGPFAYDVRASSFGNISTVGEFNAALPLSAFSPAVPPPYLPAGSVQTLTITGLTPDVVYCFAARTSDSNVPQAIGGWLRSVPRNLNVFNCAAAANIQPPMSPFGIRIATNGVTADLSWMPVRRYRHGVPFADVYAPTPFELSGYMVFKATAPVGATWSTLGTVSTATWTFSDGAAAPGYFYGVKAINSNGASRMSMIRAYTGEAYAIGADDRSYMMIPNEAMLDPLQGVAGNPGDPDTAYLVASSTHNDQLGGRVLKAIDFKPLKGGGTYYNTLALSGPATLHIRFEQTASSVTPSGFGTAAAAPQPTDLSVFWFNGSKWLQLYGKLSGIDQTMVVQTPYFGEYQLRQGERLGQFNFNGAGITNRMITPNKDGKNDDTVFMFDNPQGSQVSVKIFDMKGKLVTTVTQPGPVPNNSVVWDGTAGGVVVPSGVYIYQIGAEGQSFNGTIVVIK